MAAAAIELVVADVPDGVGVRPRRGARGGRRATTSSPCCSRSSTSPTATSSSVTSKVVSKAEGRVVDGDRDDAAARRDRAGGGPARPDHDRAHPARADHGRGRHRRLQRRARLRRAAPRSTRTPRPAGSAPTSPTRTGRNVGVVVTDTAGRAWREGQTDIAVGAAGIRVLEEYAGRVDAHGNELAVTAPAVADEIAGLAELAQGKLGGRPFAVVRGRADLVLPAGRRRAGRGGAGPGGGRGPVRLRRPRGGAARGPRRARRRRAVRRAGRRSTSCTGRSPRRGCGCDESAGTWPPYGSWRSPTAGAPTSPSDGRRYRVATPHSVDSARSRAPRFEVCRAVAKAAKSDRQKVIDDIKKKQKGAEKRRGMMIVGVCVVIAAAHRRRRRLPPGQGLVGAAAVQRRRPGLDRRAGVGLRRHREEGRRGRERPPDHRGADHLRGRAAGVRPALERGQASPPRRSTSGSTPTTTAPSSSRSCTTSSTATRSSGTTRRSPTTPTSWSRSRASPRSST